MPKHQQAQAAEKTDHLKQQPTVHDNLAAQPVSQHPGAILQRARTSPRLLKPGDVRQSQRILGNQVVVQLLSEQSTPAAQPRLQVSSAATPQILRKLDTTITEPKTTLKESKDTPASSLNKDIQTYNLQDAKARLEIGGKKSSDSTDSAEKDVHACVKQLDKIEHFVYGWFGQVKPKHDDATAKEMLALLNETKREHEYWTGIIVKHGYNIWTEDGAKDDQEGQLAKVWDDIVSTHAVFEFDETVFWTTDKAPKKAIDQFKQEMYSMLARLLSRPQGRQLLFRLYEAGKAGGKKLTFRIRHGKEDLPGYRAEPYGAPDFKKNEEKVEQGKGARVEVAVAPGIRESSFADKDESGKPILSPAFVGLGHELVHALHMMTGTKWGTVQLPPSHKAEAMIKKDYGGDLEEFLTIAPIDKVKQNLGGTQLQVGGKLVNADDLFKLMDKMPSEASIRQEHGLDTRWGHVSTPSPWEYGEETSKKEIPEVVKDSVAWWDIWFAEEEKKEKPVQEPQKKVDAGKKKPCFITTACVEVQGLADDCEELTVLRQFRDEYMRGLPAGEDLIALYYEIAPQVLVAIRAQENAHDVLNHLYSVIQSCVEHIKNGRNEKALAIYGEMVEKLARQYCPHLIPAALRFDRRTNL